MCPFSDDEQTKPDNKVNVIEALSQEYKEFTYVQRITDALKQIEKDHLFVDLKELISNGEQNIHRYFLVNEDDDSDEELDWKESSLNNIKMHMNNYHKELNNILARISTDNAKLSAFKKSFAEQGLSSLVAIIESNHGRIPIEETTIKDTISHKTQTSLDDTFPDMDYSSESQRIKKF